MLDLGKFIVFEGCEGSGKTTCVRALKEAMPELQFAREPGGTKLGEEIRRVLLHSAELSARTMLLLFCASRSELIENFLAPARQRGQHVIYDRYAGSSFAYQVWAFENPELETLFWQIHGAYGEIAVPTVYIYLDVDPDIGLSRIRKRSEVLNNLDLQSRDFHWRVKCGYEKFFARTPNIRIDANRDVDVVVEEVFKVIRSIIG